MKKVSLILLTICLFLASCQQENFGPLNTADQGDEVSQEMASTIAANFNATFAATTFKGESTNARLSSKEKTVKEVTPFRDEVGKPLYYIITYKEGGFVIVSAEKKTMPILAFSETSNFPIGKELPEGVKETMFSYKEGIKKIRARAATPDDRVVKEWRRLEDTEAVKALVQKARNKSAQPNNEPVDPPCQDSQLYVTLSTAAWGQGTSWNSQMPLENTFGCSGLPNGRAYTGCVATAMAIVMNFHDFPNTYNWNTMGANQFETARLMRNAANSVNMSYMCFGSGANGDAIVPGFVSSFGYSSLASYRSYNLTTITTEITTWGRPVILTGYRSGSGHAWVCDGFYEYYSCSGGTYAPMLYMNWGWDGSYNGFFSTSGFDPMGGSNYYTGLKMVTAIRRP
ncbi:C10 family peptidase [Pseudochryseolinea flava]|uniref:Spi protease inhibitor domain-containing protein n=1 Tax=Pseudochryseolinea flava TaxID=2059302 RepID=A0A364Y1S0_9BACT|nr:C10 family peptidase [Pseudochryseolinea flava]RAW00823.1 hypothetical protein DQQ10_11285 [Pseudochryseolinea flava]